MALDWGSIFGTVADALTNGADYISNNAGGIPQPQLSQGVQGPDKGFYVAPPPAPVEKKFYGSAPDDWDVASNRYNSYYTPVPDNGSAWDRMWEGVKPEPPQQNPPPMPYGADPSTYSWQDKMSSLYRNQRERQDAWDTLMHGLPGGQSM